MTDPATPAPAGGDPATSGVESADQASDVAARALVAVSAALPSRSRAGLEAGLRAALHSCPPAAIEECLLQSYLFLGFPAALTALAAWREVYPECPPPFARDDGTPDERGRRGEAVCRIVYGRAYEKLRANVRRVHPALDRWMIEEGYGKVLGRPGLDLATRELCIVALLAAAAWEPQLHSHLRGALQAGNAAARVEAALEAGLGQRQDDAWAGRARDLWRRVTAIASRSLED